MRGGGAELQAASLPVVIPIMQRLVGAVSPPPPPSSVPHSAASIPSSSFSSSASASTAAAAKELLPLLAPVLEGLQGHALALAVQRVEELTTVLPRCVVLHGGGNVCRGVRKRWVEELVDAQPRCLANQPAALLSIPFPPPPLPSLPSNHAYLSLHTHENCLQHPGSVAGQGTSYLPPPPFHFRETASSILFPLLTRAL